MSQHAEAYGGAYDSTLVPGSLRGYRRWTIKAERPLGVGLHSIGRTYHWPSASIEATCLNSKPHPSPGKDCTCGVYACHSPYDEQVRPVVVTARPENSVFGVIAASGDIELGHRGFRAQKARIVALCVSHNIEVLDSKLETEEMVHWSTEGVRSGAIGVQVTYMVRGAHWPETFHIRSRGASTSYGVQMLHRELATREMELLAQYPGVELIPTVEELISRYPEQDVSALLPEGVVPYTDMRRVIAMQRRDAVDGRLAKALAEFGTQTVEHLAAMKHEIDKFIAHEHHLRTQLHAHGTGNRKLLGRWPNA